MRTRDLKARAEELAEGYPTARNEAFNEQFREFIGNKVLSEDDVQGFMDSFTFPDEDEWSYAAVQSEIETVGDMKYQEYKDER